MHESPDLAFTLRGGFLKANKIFLYLLRVALKKSGATVLAGVLAVSYKLQWRPLHRSKFLHGFRLGIFPDLRTKFRYALQAQGLSPWLDVRSI